MTTMQFSDVDLSLLKLAPAKANKSSPGFKSSYVQYKSGERLNIQTPVMKLPWDIKPKQMDEGSNVSAQLALSFTGIDPDDPECDLNKFMLFMNYPPTIQPKIWLRCKEGGSSKCVDDHEMDIAVYNMEQQMIEPDNLAKGCMAAAIIEANTAWCSSMGVGVTWVAKQVVVKPIAKEEFEW